MNSSQEQPGHGWLAHCRWALIGGIGALTIGVQQAKAVTLNTLVNFNGTNGNDPTAGLIQSSNGNFFGTTFSGGTNNQGTVFEITPQGSLTTLVNFNGTNGASPTARLIQDSNGNFFGTTAYGGTNNFGTVFELTPQGSLTTLFNFNNGPNGVGPVAGLIQGSNGNFFGTTAYGGTNNSGTVFELTPQGSLTTLFNNFNPTNGGELFAGLIQGSNGNFFGTTAYGGTGGKGTVFELTPQGSLTTLVNFNGTNGYLPEAGLIQGSNGNFFGTTAYGGTNGGGTVFELTPQGGLTTLVNFNGTNGASPDAELIQDSNGNFFGTTFSGGTNNDGTVFELTPQGSLTTLVNFNGTNGARPQARLIQDSNGNFFGTTSSGGTNNDGTVFELITTPQPVPEPDSLLGYLTVAAIVLAPSLKRLLSQH